MLYAHTDENCLQRNTYWNELHIINFCWGSGQKSISAAMRRWGSQGHGRNYPALLSFLEASLPMDLNAMLIIAKVVNPTGRIQNQPFCYPHRVFLPIPGSESFQSINARGSTAQTAAQILDEGRRIS